MEFIISVVNIRKFHSSPNNSEYIICAIPLHNNNLKPLVDVETDHGQHTTQNYLPVRPAQIHVFLDKII